MKNPSRKWQVIAVGSLLAVSAITFRFGVSAQTGSQRLRYRDTARFGIIGITGDQTARLNVVIVPDEPDREIKPIPVKLMFVDEAGNTVNPSPACTECPAEMKATLEAGKSTHFALSGYHVGLSPVQRIQFRPVVQFPGDPIRPDFSIISTLEVIGDNTSRTMFVHFPGGPAR